MKEGSINNINFPLVECLDECLVLCRVNSRHRTDDTASWYDERQGHTPII